MPESAAQRISEELDFDVDELREKYREERERRLRPDAQQQYLVPMGAYAHFATDDPYAPEPPHRAPLTDEIEVVIVGGGFSGMLTAARLREAGIDDIRIVEAGADFGGTWYWNRYPGAQCDIESYCYMPLLEETEYMPKEKYSYAPEIFEHSQRIGEQYGLYDRACFQTRVSDMRWDESTKRWIVHTDRGDAMKARFVVVATGPLSRPKLPNIPGVEDFRGHSFHTSRWDYEYTGGDNTGNLHKLSDKRIAIIGTGATAIQCVPFLGQFAQHLYVFQRTPSSVDIRGNKPTDPEWAQALEPGWQRRRRENFVDILTGKDVDVDLVDDGWTERFRIQALMMRQGVEDAALIAEIADMTKMNQLRARVDEMVKDPETAELLKPWYQIMCKRPCFNDEYLATFNRPNVTLVDTSWCYGVERITESGVVANGEEYPVDCIIYATGFDVNASAGHRFDFEVLGERESLSDHWRHGVRTLHGHSTRGFPNWFFVGVGQNGFSVNMTAMFDDQARHLAYIIGEAKKRGAQCVQPTEQGERAWVDEMHRFAAPSRAFFESCTPGYLNNEGKLDGEVTAIFAETYALGVNAFNDILEAWREKGDLEGLELS